MNLKHTYRMASPALVAMTGLIVTAAPALGQRQLEVVTTLTTYAAIAREVGGDLAHVQSIARGDVDPHFVAARPSFAAIMSRADMLVTTGLDLELWLPALLDRANNSKIVDGAPGQVVTHAGIKLLQVPQNASRAGGDVHIFGNPHIHTDPVNAIIIAKNILAGYIRVDPDHQATYEANEADFEHRVASHLFGDQLLDMLGQETLLQIASGGDLWSFLSGQSYQGKPLTEYVGGWLKQAEVFRGTRIACYHKEWAYFSARFDVECAIYVEPKPGIPPSPGHVREVIDFIRTNNIRALLAANFFSRTQVERVADRTGAKGVVVPMHEGGEEGVDDYFKLVDTWISRLSAAFTP